MLIAHVIALTSSWSATLKVARKSDLKTTCSPDHWHKLWRGCAWHAAHNVSEDGLAFSRRAGVGLDRVYSRSYRARCGYGGSQARSFSLAASNDLIYAEGFTPSFGIGVDFSLPHVS